MTNAEAWRIRLDAVPHYWDKRELLKFLKPHFTPTRIQKPPRLSWATLIFDLEQDHDKAMECISSGKLETKSGVMTVAVVPPKGPAVLQKTEAESSLPLYEQLNDRVTPLWRQTYEQQLQRKQRDVAKIVGRFQRELSNSAASGDGSGKRVYPSAVENVMLQILPAPEEGRAGYRTKCELSIGKAMEGPLNTDGHIPEQKLQEASQNREKIPLTVDGITSDSDTPAKESSSQVGMQNDRSDFVVGFMMGLFRDGITQVAPIDHCVHVCCRTKTIAQAMTQFLRHDSLFPEPYDRQTKQGHWRLIMTRTHRGRNEAGDVESEQAAIKNHFIQQSFPDFQIKTLLWQSYAGLSHIVDSKEPIHVLFGPGFITEELALSSTAPLKRSEPFRFRVSPLSFFQSNTLACQVLYSRVADWIAESATEDQPIKLLDLCCGTGTIGIALTALEQVQQVTGIEICAEAVQDARLNAESNGVQDKIKYLCGPIEDMLPQVLKTLPDAESGKPSEVVGILDPPRAGVHASVIQAIRSCARLRRLIFIACNPAAASQNWMGLCRPESRRYAGKPFRLARCQPVDLFPHTQHCELLLEFKRCVE